MKRKYFNLIFIAVVLGLTVQISYLFGGTDQVTNAQTLPKGVSIYQLDNGMQVLLIENPALPMVGVNVVVKVGSAYESFSTSGMCHMLEHLLFNGTTSRTQKQLYDDVDFIGGYNNASTADYYTNYMMVTPAEQIQKGMEIQADMLFNSVLPQDKFEKEKGIVLEEISKSLANPSEQMERNTSAILYNGHALSLPTLGTYSTIESMNRDDVYAFYTNNYVPNNMILSAIGNFDSKTMLSMIKDIYGKASPGQVKREITPGWSTGFQPQDGSMQPQDMTYYRFYDGKNTEIQMFYRIPKGRSSEYFALINLVLGKNSDDIQNAMKSEFPDLVQAVRLSTRLTPLSNYVQASVTAANNVDFNAIIKFMSIKLTSLNFSLPKETVEAETIQSRTNFLKNIEKPHMFGIYNSHELVVNGIESVLSSSTGNEYYNAAKELLPLKLVSNPIVIIQSPSAAQEIEKTGTSGITKLFHNEDVGKNLIAKQNDVSDLLAIHYLIKHKAMFESKYGVGASKVLHDCIEQRLNSDANQQMSKKHGLTYVFNDNPYIPMDNIYLHPDFGYIRVEGLSDDMPGVIKYLSEQFKNFEPTEDEFKKAVEKFKGLEMMERMRGDKAQKLFNDTYESIVYEPSPYSTDKLELTYDNILAFTKEYFQPENMIISVVSPVDPDSVNILFDQFKGKPFLSEPSAYTPTFLMQTKDTTIIKDGNTDRSYLFWGFINKIDPNDAPTLQALSLILADDIIFDIREKKGMAYHMSAGIEIVNDKALFYINQGTRPQNVDVLVPQYPKYFTMAAIDNLTQEKLQKSINMYLGRMMFRRLSSINQAYYLGNSFYFQNDVNYDNEFFNKLKNVKLEDVKEAAEKYMNVINPITIIVK